jgi:hypothetical protein
MSGNDDIIKEDQGGGCFFHSFGGTGVIEMEKFLDQASDGN